MSKPRCRADAQEAETRRRGEDSVEKREVVHSLPKSACLVMAEVRSTVVVEGAEQILVGPGKLVCLAAIRRSLGLTLEILAVALIDSSPDDSNVQQWAHNLLRETLADGEEHR